MVEANSAGAAREAVTDLPAEALLLDLHSEDSHGFSALMDFRQDFPALPVIVVSASEGLRVSSVAAQLGAAAFIPKSASLELRRDALAAVRQGDSRFPDANSEPDDDLDRIASLTRAQGRLLGQLHAGLLNKQIAYELEISEATVKAHITAIFRKLGVASRTQAVLFAAKLNVDQPTSDPVSN